MSLFIGDYALYFEYVDAQLTDSLETFCDSTHFVVIRETLYNWNFG